LAPDPREQLRLARERRLREQTEPDERWREDTVELPAVSAGRPGRSRGPRVVALGALGLVTLLALGLAVDRSGSGGSLVARSLSQLGLLSPAGPEDREAEPAEQAEPTESPLVSASPTPVVPSEEPARARSDPADGGRPGGPDGPGPGAGGPARGGPGPRGPGSR